MVDHEGTIPKVHILADPPVLDLLCQLMEAEPFRHELLIDVDVLVVYAHGETNGTHGYSVLSGLKKLQKLLAEVHSFPGHVYVLGFLPPSSLGKYSYILKHHKLVTYYQLPILPRLSSHPSALWEDLAREASERELELDCSAYRHGLRSVIAAVRIYLGAAIAGHVNIEELSGTLAKFEHLAKKLGALEDVNSMLLTHKLRSHQRFSKSYRRSARLKDVSVWLLDDHCDDHGWNLLFTQLGLRAFRAFSDWKALEKEMSPNVHRPDVLVVDCNLGSGNTVPTGLELLGSIRSVWQDVRIVFATAYDDAGLALTSLREGANRFFAKQLNDPTDRGSREYYEQLIETLTPHPFSRAVSEWWQTFLNKLDAKGNLTLINGTPAPPELPRLMRLAFYLLFAHLDIDTRFGLGGQRLSSSGTMRAVTNLIRLGFPSWKKETYGTAYHLFKNAPHGGADRDFGGIENMHAVFDAILKRLADARTGTNSVTIKVWSRAFPLYWPYREPQELQTDSAYPGLAPGAVPLAQDAADLQGAIELLRGTFCSSSCRHSLSTCRDILNDHPHNNKASSADIVLIDYQGVSAPWFEAIQVLFPGCRVYSDVNSFLADPLFTNLLILNLDLPNSKDGLGALEQISHQQPDLPILAMSGSTSWLPAIRSMRQGAADFVAKTIPGQRNSDACFRFADEFYQKCLLLQKYGKSECRAAWGRWNRFNTRSSWKSNAGEEYVRARVSKIADSWRHRGDLIVPPDPSEWGPIMKEKLRLILLLWRRIFEFRSTEFDGKVGRLNNRRVYRIRPVDEWLFEHVLNEQPNSANLVQLMALLAGGLVDQLAQWDWCLQNVAAIDTSDWGNSIEIHQQTTAIGGQTAWDYRNAVIHHVRQWGFNDCARIVDSAFAAIHRFGKPYGWHTGGVV